MSASTPAAAVVNSDAARRPRVLAPPAVVAILTALAVAALIMWLTRLVFLEPAQFSGDFSNDTWYIMHQADALAAAHVPTLHLSSTTAAFYPIFAFYGGTLFVAIGALSILTGASAQMAQAMTYAIAFGAAYGGWYWLARLAGIRGWVAHAPGFVYITAPYVITNIYARQDLVETVATAAMPLMVAAAISVGRADRLRPGPAAALAAATIAFTGSHNLTLLWGTLYLSIAAAVALVALPETRRLITRRGVLRIAVVVVPAIAVNAWFLLPDLFYANDTAIAQRLDQARGFLRTPTSQLSLAHLLTPTRPDDAQGAGYTLPILTLAWTLTAVATARAPRRSAWLRLWGLLTVATLAIVVLMGQAHVLAGLPDVFVYIQSGIRLDTYALFSLCGALIAALALGPPRWLKAALVAVLAIGLVQAAIQIDKVPPGPLAPPIVFEDITTFGLGDYADAALPAIKPPRGQAVYNITHAMTRGQDHITLTRSEAPGDMFLTNLMGPASLLKVDGARIVGRWDAGPATPVWQHLWYLVLQIPPDAAKGLHQVTVGPADTPPIIAGRVISILGLLGLLAVAVAAVRPRRRA